ncbi:PaaI family thioesterase [Pseudaminobacter sp. NGMCC 1.201702]|uniref:PaaI family thioesterase n=1 Tax=Pseudaminobacter sp. NGMCC 1.201702 TaxID=3391825 RepID=UPI0039EE24EF
MPIQANMQPLMTAGEINEFLKTAYPQLNADFNAYEAVEVFAGGCTVRLNADERHLRPGGTVSGPSLFTLADIGGYACVLSHAGPDALSVTTNLTINFMRKAEAGPIHGHCRILKLGRSLMVFDIDIIAGADGQTVAHATGTYSIPPKSNAVATQAMR